MSQSKLTRELYNQVSRLKLANKPDAPVRFRLTQSPFPNDDDALELSANRSEHIIRGLIYPKSEIFNEGAFEIEMKISNAYPAEPPIVRFITRIYHPNVAPDGEICVELLKKTSQYRPSTTLLDVVGAIVDYIDHPNIDYAASPELGRQYVENRLEFNNTAREFVRQHAVRRD